MITLILTTAPDRVCAQTIATTLLERKLAACVSILPEIESHYVWQGRRERAEEVQVFIKSTAARWEALRDAIVELHPYDCPEILRFDAAQALQAYAAWVGDCVRS